MKARRLKISHICLIPAEVIPLKLVLDYSRFPKFQEGLEIANPVILFHHADSLSRGFTCVFILHENIQLNALGNIVRGELGTPL